MKTKTQESLIKLGEQLAKNLNLIARSNKSIKPRNYLVLNPLLQKGGLHEKDDIVLVRKRQRRQCRQELRRTDWFNQSDV
ncbi:MAG: hypothetical protein Q4B81_07620 [Moraxella sp.]|nr:hypothetical protein [Moraxella sp.]